MTDDDLDATWGGGADDATPTLALVLWVTLALLALAWIAANAE